VFIEVQILEIEKMLRNAKVIDEQDVNSDIVGVGSKVTLIDVNNKTEVKYRIVGSAEADPEQAKISNESPVGRSLIGKKVGDKVNVEAPIGTIKYQVKAITK
jgi:transcription elongation factor GreA